MTDVPLTFDVPVPTYRCPLCGASLMLLDTSTVAVGRTDSVEAAIAAVTRVIGDRTDAVIRIHLDRHHPGWTEDALVDLADRYRNGVRAQALALRCDQLLEEAHRVILGRGLDGSPTSVGYAFERTIKVMAEQARLVARDAGLEHVI